MACTASRHSLARLTRPTVIPAGARSLFSFPNPFGSPASSSSAAPIKKGSLVKRGSIWVYNEGKVMPYTPRELYAVIADVDSYKDFLPFTSASRVLSAAQLSPDQQSRTSRPVGEKGWLVVRDEQNEGERWEMDAELRIGALGFDEGYVSRVEMLKARSVKATARDASMFRHLVNVWSFYPLPPSPSPPSTPQTQVDLSLEYAFTSPLHAAAMNTVWDKVSALMVERFEQRVIDVHGKR
ncbi:hypothetical protein JCM21900_005336 [Sporobolomyces salmonicolor]